MLTAEQLRRKRCPWPNGGTSRSPQSPYPAEANWEQVLGPALRLRMVAAGRAPLVPSAGARRSPYERRVANDGRDEEDDG